MNGLIALKHIHPSNHFRASGGSFGLEKKKSSRYFRHIFDKLKPIFIFFDMIRQEYSFD